MNDQQDDQDFDALADAVLARRDELGYTQQALADRSRTLDVLHFGGDQRAKPGLSVRTWYEIEAAKPKRKTMHTMKVIDATLVWPAGTTRAILEGRPLPEGDPVDLPTTGTANTEVSEAMMRAREARSRAEVAELRAEVADLGVRLEQVEQTLRQALKLIE